MRLRNKKTGEIIDAFFEHRGVNQPLEVWAWHRIQMNTMMGEYDSLSAVFEEWEDAKEEKEKENE